MFKKVPSVSSADRRVVFITYSLSLLLFLTFLTSSSIFMPFSLLFLPAFSYLAKRTTWRQHVVSFQCYVGAKVAEKCVFISISVFFLVKNIRRLSKGMLVVMNRNKDEENNSRSFERDGVLSISSSKLIVSQFEIILVKTILNYQSL